MSGADVTTSVGKLGDRATSNGVLTMHQAGLPITVSGHRMSEKARMMTKDPTTAVALGYDRRGDDLPRVLAKGKGAIADQIIAIAEENGVAVHRDEDLVEVLDRLEIDAPIPVAAFAAVAEILAHLYRLNDDMGTSP